MKKRNHVLLTDQDEAVFSNEIKQAFPSTVFVEGNRWETANPPAKNSIIDCKTEYVFIWNQEIFETLPYIRRDDGVFQGPTVGPVIMLIRSRFKDENIFLSGEIAAGITVERPGKEKMIEFAKSIWKILKKVAPKKVAEVHPTTKWIGEVDRHILVGNDAYEWCRAKEERFLKYNNSPNYYLRPF